MKRADLTLWAPAKVNLTLAVVGRRADGYHLIRSVMQKVSLYDTLSFYRCEDVSLECDLKYLPTDERNLCVRAANLYFEKTGVAGGVHMRVRKAIPLGSGLGGGSGDAACVLRALCRLYEPLSEAELMTLGTALGADVPFCLSAHATCLCEGIGDELTPLESAFCVPPSILLVKDERKLSTAQVYGVFDEMPAPAAADDSALISALQQGDLQTLSEGVFNHLEAAVLPQKPLLIEQMRQMRQAGALCARMSGAGPTIYGLFETSQSAARAAARFSSAAFVRRASFLQSE